MALLLKDEEKVRLLLQAGVSYNEKNGFKYTPEEIARNTGNENIIALFEHHKAKE